MRLEQKTRLAAMRGEIAALEPRAATALAAAEAAAAAAVASARAARGAREALRERDQAAGEARALWGRFEREAARREAQAQSLADTVERFAAELAEADEALGASCREPRRRPATRRTWPSGWMRRGGARLRRAKRRRRRGRLSTPKRGKRAGGRGDWRASPAKGQNGPLAPARPPSRSAPWPRRERPPKRSASPRSPRRRSWRTAAAALWTNWPAPRRGAALRRTNWPWPRSARTRSDQAARAAEAAGADAREVQAGARARLEAARERLAEQAQALESAAEDPGATQAPANDTEAASEDEAAGPAQTEASELRLAALERERDGMGPVNLMAETDAAELAARLTGLNAERGDLSGALTRLHAAIAELNAEGRERLLAAFSVIDGHFRGLFTTLFQGGQAELRLVESDDPLEAGLEIYACPPGKRMAVMSLMSGGEQALTATALIFAVFLANPAPICVLDEVDAPLDDANVERLCDLLAEMRKRAPTRFVVITHNPLTMSRMDRLYGVTMREKGVSQLVSVDLTQAEAMAAQ